MNKIISSCGLDCASCDARIATLRNDNELRLQTAEKWKVIHNAPSITPEMINCTGCREEGIKFSHCSQCEIRSCSTSKGYTTCAECDTLEICEIVQNIHKYVPDALENLKSIR